MRVLVIDDDFGIRCGAEAVLEEGYEVELAESGRDALKMLRGGLEVDLILCDMQMPGKDGLEVWRRLPEDLRGRFVMWTADPSYVQSQIEYRFGGQARGEEMFEVLKKPVSNRDLLAALRRVAP
jgi:chemosensory pili system protein ChpA (sensor histidine kinase/response regulator)